jgi:predicted TIM-barrel fold metal-dependent hydrolase
MLTSDPFSPTTDSGERALVISTDGHAMARMEEYRSYLPSRLHEEFDAFCKYYRQHGARATDAATLAPRVDPYIIDQWTKQVLETDCIEGVSDPKARIIQQDRFGFAGEVLFPDFGLPFEIGSPFHSFLLGHVRTPDQIDAANRAHNRWLVDFCSVAPERFAAMAVVSFEDVDAAVKEIRWAKEAGLKGVLLPHFDEEVPLYDTRFEPIWNTVEELGMPLNSHAGSSSITKRYVATPKVDLPPEFNAYPFHTQTTLFYCHQILNHLIWGGVLERHPDMKVVFTEQGSGWVPGTLINMDYTYDGSYLRRDVHEFVRHMPSEYFARQCSLGSSLFSRAEVEARHVIGIDKMALGSDYPHHEGAWAGPGPTAYLRATLGAASVPVNDARMILGENAAAVWGFDLDALGVIASRIGPLFEEILTPPTTNEFPRGDVNKPMGVAA